MVLENELMAKLNPLKPLKKLQPYGFYTFDSETKDGLKGKELFCWSLAYLGKDRKYKTLEGNESLDELFKKLFEWKHEKLFKIIYIHNLSFDIRFLIEYCIQKDISFKPIISGSKFIACILDEYKIKFIDSVQFLFATQEKAEKEWNIESEFTKEQTKILMNELFENEEYKEGLKPFNKWSENEKELLKKHCRNDTIALHKIMKKFRETMFEIAHVDIFSILSLASLSMKAYRITMDKPLLNPFLYFHKNKNGKIGYRIDKEKEHFVRESYFGGRNEVFNLKRLPNRLYVDAVSMFPDAMKHKKYPLGNPNWIYKKKDNQIFEDILNNKSDKLAILSAIIEPTNKVHTNYPIIPKRIDNKVMFTNMKFSGIYTSVELQYAKECGYKITPNPIKISQNLQDIIGLVYPKKGFIFSKFVDKFFKIKSTNEGGRKHGAKILLNACYGKFGQTFERKSFLMNYFTEESDMLDFQDLHEEPDKLISRYDKNIHIYMVMYPFDSIVMKPFMNVAISSFITAYSRIKLTKMVHKVESIKHIYDKTPVDYCDTDSVVIKPNYFKKLKKLKDENGKPLIRKDLGGWDIEQKFDEIQFLAPKAYMSIQDGIPKLKLKGVMKSKINEIIKPENFCGMPIQKNLDEIYDEVHKEIKMSEIYMKFKEAFRFGMVLATKTPTKEYSFENLKRNFKRKKEKSIPWNNQNAPKEYLDQCFSKYL